MKLPDEFWSVSSALMKQDHRYQELLSECRACESGMDEIRAQLSPENQAILDAFVCASLELGFRLASLVASHYAAQKGQDSTAAHPQEQ